jgi:O-antigen ligase
MLDDRRREALVSTVPVFVGLIAGAAIVFLASSRMATLVGLGVIGVTFLVSGMNVVKRVLLAVMVLEIPIQVDIYLDHDPVEAARAALSGHNISVTTLCLMALYGIWFVEFVAGRSAGWSPILRRSIPAIAYLAVIVSSLWVATDTDLVWFEANLVVQAFLMMVYVAHAVRDTLDLSLVVGMLFLGVLLQFGLSAIASTTGTNVRIGVVGTRAVGERVSGTLGHPNILGAYLAMVLPVAAAVVVAPFARWLRWLAGGAFAAGAVLLGLSQSRGGFLGFILGMGVLVALMYGYQLVPRRILLRAAGLASIPLALQFALVVSRLTDIDNTAAVSRLPLISLSLTMIADHPLWGVGANNFAATLDQYLTVDFANAWISTVHNRYLLVWAETGLVGLMAFLWFLASTLRRGLSIVRSSIRSFSLVAAGVVGGVVAGMIHMVVDMYHQRPLIQLLWLFAGLLIGIQLASSRPSSGIEPSGGALLNRSS